MNRISINSILARYQYSFGYVAGNVAKVVANRVWANLVKLHQYSDVEYSGSGNKEIPLFEVGDISFANVEFENSKSGRVYKFGTPGEYGVGKKFLAPPLMVSFSRGKNVVKTAIDRSEIEVIEYFGLKPYTIKIQGILIDMENHGYPSELVQEANRMFEEPGTFKVTGTIFQDLGISEIFFEDGFEVSFVEGYADTVKFSVDATMTSPLELIATGL
ncbi:DUF6046 domain-containing protein [Acetobacteroides hydrogenigenes]|uniref:DUF6046 domain-containing protein n=1 Tax=Acetobacteroides hydrogenigenes TaxID=979970 RepID=A0A4V2RNH3_9BACT|nr:DUF6046 domain-containing protein [Acetobacteroides hydrogenigenes]TCN63680.1 hypothetical protein CLV25_11530 [Acetobacteroides hydrogenigenes]